MLISKCLCLFLVAVCEDHSVAGPPEPAAPVRQPRVLGLRLLPEGLSPARRAGHS
ncbi:hypothetical protein EK904_005972 [Melospiza melodia maxima]|nr:hypothetical protein EK904_005972 [Melospiza melodia maxima]